MLRRLTRVEYANTIRDLLDVPVANGPASSFSVDETRGGFASNSVSPVSELNLEQYSTAAEFIVSRHVNMELAKKWSAPCEPETGDKAACARKFIANFGKRAFRRTLSETEITTYFNNLLEAGAASSAFLLPFSRSLSSSAQPVVPKRFISIFTGCGVQMSSWRPRLDPAWSATNATAFSLEHTANDFKSMDPMKVHKDDLLIIDGLDIPAADFSDGRINVGGVTIRALLREPQAKWYRSTSGPMDHRLMK